MAGYMRKLQGYVYNGDHQAAEAMENGLFVEIGANGVVPITAAGDAELRVAEKTTLWGRDALVLDVVISGTKDQFFLENEWDFCDVCDYNTSTHTCRVGEYCRMHRLLEGEQLIMTVAADVAAGLEVGDTVTPAVGGSVAKKA